MGSDRKGNRLRSRHSKFQSTLPGWGATGVLFEHIQAHNHFNPRSPDGERLFQPVLEDDGTDISIHAPRMGSDLGFSLFIQWSKDFNPRSPDGERPEIVRRLLETVFISIHAPRMGSDWQCRYGPAPHSIFQSTLPGWGATGAAAAYPGTATDFNPRSPDGERPRKWTSSPTIWAKSSIFNTDCIADRR